MMTRCSLVAILFLVASSCSLALEHHHRHKKHGHKHKHSLRAPKLPWLDNSTKKEDVAHVAVTVSNVTDSHAMVLSAAASEAAAKKAEFERAMTQGAAAADAAKLQALGDKCKCDFHDVCDCEASLKFMNCITEACASNRCACEAEQYHASCLNIALTCPSLEFVCSNEKAVCRESTDETPIHDLPTDVVQGDLKHALKKRCTYIAAEKKGYVNADNQLKNLEPLIKKYQDTLTERGEHVPTHTCPGEKEKPATKPEPQGFKAYNPEPLDLGGSGAAGSDAVRSFQNPKWALALLLALLFAR